MVKTKDKTVEKNENNVAQVIDELVVKGNAALQELKKFNQEQIYKICHDMTMAALNQHMPLAKMSVEETMKIKQLKICLRQKVSGIVSNIIKQ